MKKTLLIIFAGKETHEGKGRVFNALIMAKELKEAGHIVNIIFDGAGTEWLAKLQMEDNKMHALYIELKDNIVGGCDFCAVAFNVKDILKEKDIPLSSDFMGHTSFKKYIEEDYKIITF